MNEAKREAKIAQAKLEMEKILRQLGVECAGTRKDPLRWSVSDLATDLAPIILELIE